MTKRAVVLHSGGLDSTTLIYYLLEQSYEVRTFSINYGQRHEKELQAAYFTSLKAQVSWKMIDLRSLVSFLGGSALTDPNIAVPDGLYDEASMAVTVVPNRNMILYSIAAGYADSISFHYVAGAQHAGDHAIYPDCRPEFLEHCNNAIKAATEGRVEMLYPFYEMTKTSIVQHASRLHVPTECTWSCYKGGAIHCGRCGTCTERIEAFLNAGVIDPTIYEANAYRETVQLLQDRGRLLEA